MHSRRFGNRYLICLAAGEEIISSLKAFCRRERVQFASFVGLGAVTRVTLGLFRNGMKNYLSDIITGEFAQAPLTGTIAAPRGVPRVHCRINLDGAAATASRGGRLNSAVVSDTCEIVLEVVDHKVMPGGGHDPDCRQLDFAA